jgi:FHA domain
VLTLDGAVGADDPFADLHDLRAGIVPGRGVVIATPTAPRHAAITAGQVPARANEPPAPAAAAAPEPVAAPGARNGRDSGPDSDRDGTSPTSPVRTSPPVRGAEPPAAPGAPAVPEEGPVEQTALDGSGPPPVPPAPPTPEQPPPLRAPRRAERIDQPTHTSQRAPLTPGRPLSPARLAKPAAPPAEPPGAPARPEPPTDRHDDSPVVDGPRTRGHLCSRGHLNDPRSHFCVLCGIRMNERTGELVFGARPPLGLIVFDDGATYTVDAEYLVGRMPDVDERVRTGSLRSIVIEDRSGAISRVHAEVRVQGWDVLLVDSRSRNGTHVAEPGATAWTPLAAGRSHRLTPGTRVRLGSRTFLFESPSGVR